MKVTMLQHVSCGDVTTATYSSHDVGTNNHQSCSSRNMRGILRSKCPDGCQALSPHSSRIQATLNNSKIIHRDLKSQVPMRQPAPNIKNLNSNVVQVGPRLTSPTNPQMSEHPLQPSFQRVPTKQKKLELEKKVSHNLWLQFPRGAPSALIYHTCLITMETGQSHKG